MITDWQGALDALYGLTNWETRPPGTILSFELDRMRRLLAGLGDPQHRWRAVHVGGTNGKGSTCAMIAAGLRAARHRVGLYSSPHLHTVRERIQVDGRPITEADVIAWLNQHASLLESLPGLTTFEALTALAFDHFATAGADIAVIEVGLGGRLDSTNVLEAPELCVITPVGMDHAAVLGPTPAIIACDKSGIFKPGRPVVAAPQLPEVRAVLREEAAAVGCRMVEVEAEATWSGGQALPGGGQRFDLALADGAMEPVEIALNGAFQRLNAATAAVALRELDVLGWGTGRRERLAGLAAARWPGRLEFWDTSAVLGRPGPVLVLDGAHNPPAGLVLHEALAERWPGRPRHFILGCSLDKDIEGLLAALLPGAASVSTFRAPHPRALSAAELAARIRGLADAPPVVTPAQDASAALDQALLRATRGDVIVGTGSIFVAAALRWEWARRGGLPLPERDPELGS